MNNVPTWITRKLLLNEPSLRDISAGWLEKLALPEKEWEYDAFVAKVAEDWQDATQSGKRGPKDSNYETLDEKRISEIVKSIM